MTETDSSSAQTRNALVVLSNRLPVDHVVDAQGNGTWRSSPGGLVTALEPVVKASGGSWIGWSGATDDDLEPFEHDGMRIPGREYVVTGCHEIGVREDCCEIAPCSCWRGDRES